MEYTLSFEICAFVFLLIIAIRFSRMRKFSTLQNRMFGAIVHCAIFDIVLDIAGSLAIRYAQVIPEWINYTVNTLFYIMQALLPMLLLFYVYFLSSSRYKKTKMLSVIPASFTIFLVVTNAFTQNIFYIEGTAYIHGKLFPIIYINSAFYLLMTVIVTLCLRRRFRKVESRTIISFVAIICASLVLQFMFPKILLTGIAMAIAIFLMFISMQNPESMLDTITGTYNYEAFVNYIRMRLSENRNIWITAVDVGGIRRINSALGIRVGNELLENIGNYMNLCCTRHAKAFRLIGTRFIIVSDNEATHKEIISKISYRFDLPWIYSENESLLMATIRYCERGDGFSSPEDVISIVDLAYSKASEEGFGTMKPIGDEKLSMLRRKNQVIEAIRRAISNGNGFYLNYQPLYSIKEKRFTSAEALLRLNDPELGSISPSEFIPIAESAGLISQIDIIVVKMACNFIKSHPELFNGKIRQLEINLSASEFNSEKSHILSDIYSEVESIEDKVCFEVTETAVTVQNEVLSEFMYKLIDKGVKFAIDDFGTGYTNIAQLTKLPFSVVKLDKMFVSGGHNRESAIAEGLMRMFKSIGLSTVFEGIETEEQAAFADKLDVDCIQGFYYSSPLEPEELIKLILNK